MKNGEGTIQKEEPFLICFKFMHLLVDSYMCSDQGLELATLTYHNDALTN